LKFEIQLTQFTHLSLSNSLCFMLFFFCSFSHQITSTGSRHCLPSIASSHISTMKKNCDTFPAGNHFRNAKNIHGMNEKHLFFCTTKTNTSNDTDFFISFSLHVNCEEIRLIFFFIICLFNCRSNWCRIALEKKS
jgi:hypothetical protein